MRSCNEAEPNSRFGSTPGAQLGKRDAKPALSRRQFECLQGVADLLDSVQIADRLGISEHTVNGHLAAATAALGASSRRDAVRKYLTLQTEHPEKVTGQFLRVSLGVDFIPARVPTATVQESAMPIWQPEPATVPADRGADHDVSNRLSTLAIVIGLAAAIAILIIAIDPLVESAMRLANNIQPYHHR